MLLREGSHWGTKACEEMGRTFMVAYRNAHRGAISNPTPSLTTTRPPGTMGIPLYGDRSSAHRGRGPTT